MNPPVATTRFTVVPERVQNAYQHHKAGRLRSAAALCRQVLDEQDGEPHATNLLGLITFQCGDRDAGLALIERSIKAEPGVPDFHNTYATALGVLGRYDEAAAALRRAIAIRPDIAAVHCNLAIASAKAGKLHDAIDSFHEAVLLAPDDVEMQQDLIGLYRATGRLDDAISAMRFLLKRRPDDAAVHSDLLLTLHYHPATTPRSLYAETLKWADRHARPYYPAEPIHFNSTADDPSTRGPPLRVGYVSADFREHPVGRFILPVLRAHDRTRFQIVCYSDVLQADALTAEARRHCTEWHDVAGLTDEVLTQRIRADRIDVLVDLAGHMGLQRLMVFARRAAPVQVTYLGYPGTTGVSTIDYRITDACHDPENETDACHTERLVRLPGTCWSYDPCVGLKEDVPIAALPCDSRGIVTFGCLNRAMKVTPEVLRLWSRILDQVPDSRLHLLADEGAERSISQRITPSGLCSDRVDVISRAARPQYLQHFNQIDIHLDTYPYNGHTTTCDALWMGVPTVSLAGATHASRAGLSVLSAVGLHDLVAEDPTSYVHKAVRLASDIPRLRELRSTLRDRMRQSPLMDGRRLATSLENAYIDMWRRRSSSSPVSVEVPAALHL